jgi:hypothetical protein
MKKLVEFIKGLFCKDCGIKAEAVIAKPIITEEKKEKLEKKAKQEALTKALATKAKVIKNKTDANNKSKS